nr:hypothetical protein [Kofleriaceae bacterium]
CTGRSLSSAMIRFVASGLMMAPSLVGAQPLGVPAPARTVGPNQLPDTDDLDGSYVWVGPRLSAIFRESWDSNVGVELAVVNVRERQALAAYGLSAGVSKLAVQDRTRVSFTALAGTRRLGNVMAGLTAGATLELSPLSQPAPGIVVGMWAHAGVVPFMTVGWTGGRDAGITIEAGLTIALPIWRRR